VRASPARSSRSPAVASPVREDLRHHRGFKEAASAQSTGHGLGTCYGGIAGRGYWEG
jgi:hypothetical protein